MKYTLGDEDDRLDESLCRSFMPHGASRDCAGVISEAVEDASRRLLRPSVETEISSDLKEEADKVVVTYSPTISVSFFSQPR